MAKEKDDRALSSSLRLATGGFNVMSDCQNPRCRNPVEPIENGWRRTERLFCDDKCKQQAWILRRAAALLALMGKENAWKIIESTRRGVAVVESVDEVSETILRDENLLLTDGCVSNVLSARRSSDATSGATLLPTRSVRAVGGASVIAG